MKAVAGLWRGRRAAERSGPTQNHSISLGEASLSYTLKLSVRRTLALKVDERGVRVSAPWGTALAEVERFMRQHEAWLTETVARVAHQRAHVRLRVEDGASFPLLGAMCRLRVADAAPRGGQWRFAAAGGEELVLKRVECNASGLIRAIRRRALPWFSARVEEYCCKLGVPVPPVRLTSARTRWGSCSARSGIRLHWRLFHLPPDLIDYVVAHEVAHLVEMNHSPRFWSVVGVLFPTWQQARVALLDAGRALPLIAEVEGDADFLSDV